MQRRRKPRLLPRKISIQPSPRTLKHRRSRAICRTHRQHATGTGNRVGAFNMFGVFPEKRGTKVLLPLKPKPRQTAAISGKQDFAQRRSKCRRDHQRLLSKLRNIIPRIVQTTPIDPKVTQGSRRDSATAAARPQSPRRQQARQRHSCRTTPKSPQAAGATRRSCRPRSAVPQGGRRKAPRPPPGPGPATATRPHISPAAPTNNGPHRRPLATTSPQAGAGLSFQNPPQPSAAPCPQLRRSWTRRRTWSRTF